MTTKTQIRETKEFPRTKLHGAMPPRKTIEPRNIAIGEVRGFPGAGSEVCRPWIPGVTGPNGWYDSEAVNKLVVERQARIDAVTDRIVGGIYFTGTVAMGGLLFWVLSVLVLPVIGG